MLGATVVLLLLGSPQGEVRETGSGIGQVICKQELR